MSLVKRSVYCGSVSESLIGKEITLTGWVHHRRDHGGVIFIDLRDRTGLVQLVFDPSINQDVMKVAQSLRSEYVIGAKGILAHRSEKMINPNMATGKYEVKITQVSLLSASQTLPFQLDDGDKVAEELRLTYRYLDLRRPKMQHLMKLRHDLVFALRNYFNQEGFYEIETPILSKSTPEGARDFLVPSRINHGTFYALPQSPQIYKQLLMVAGLDRYIQIARCFRDEALRADRQPEFTQLDIEMSFIDEEDIYKTCEGFLKILWKQFLHKDLELPLRRYSYVEVFNRFGSDKPDMRFDMEIHDVSSLFATSQLGFVKAALETGGKAGAIVVKDHQFSRTELDNWVDKASKEFGAQGLAYIRFNQDQTPTGSLAKHLPADFFTQAKAIVPDLTTKDSIFVMIGAHEKTWSHLGMLRVELAKALNLIDQNKHVIFWVTEFPMFEWDEDEKRWQAKHHPFTAPLPGWETKTPGEMYARAYDLVCNGYELGGGSIRIHDADMQQKVFEMMGISKEEAEQKFGFLLEAQRFGYPPDGGAAFGIERLCMILGGSESIREVIAFPKTSRMNCMMMDTPSTVDQKQLKELGITNVKK